MKKILYRLLLLLYSRFFSTDNLSNKFPVSIKAIILDDNRYLLVKNEMSEWDFPGGKLEKEESISNTLIREVKEELNLDILVNDLVYAENHLVNNLPVLIILFETSIVNEKNIILSYEHVNYNFYDLNELKNIKLTDWAKNYISLYT
tara:strand:- start:157 stop:597 length:441 start_codon:yes stop_codon:yes gene_type:complete